MICMALTDVPSIPAKFDKRNATVMGIHADKPNPKNKNGELVVGQRKNSYFSKFMLERLKKNSILNADVFKDEGIDYKKQVAKNYQRFQHIVLKDREKKNAL